MIRDGRRVDAACECERDQRIGRERLRLLDDDAAASVDRVGPDEAVNGWRSGIYSRAFEIQDAPTLRYFLNFGRTSSPIRWMHSDTTARGYRAPACSVMRHWIRC